MARVIKTAKPTYTTPSPTHRVVTPATAWSIPPTVVMLRRLEVVLTPLKQRKKSNDFVGTRGGSLILSEWFGSPPEKWIDNLSPKLGDVTVFDDGAGKPIFSQRLNPDRIVP